MNSETDDLSARIRLCAQKVGSGDELSRRSGIPRRTLENYLSGRSEPKASAISAIAIAADVTTDWLITGTGPMRRGEAAEAAPVAPAAPAGRAPLDADLLGLVIEGVHTTYRDENARIDQRNAARLAARIYDDVLIACEGDDDPGARKAALRMALQQLRRDLRAHPDETQGKQRA